MYSEKDKLGAKNTFINLLINQLIPTCFELNKLPKDMFGDAKDTF